MAQKNRAALKALFESGDAPSAQDFIDLIDSLYNKVEDSLTVTGLEPYDAARNYDTGETFTYLGVVYAAIKDGVTGAFSANNVNALFTEELFFKLDIWDNAISYGIGAIVSSGDKAYSSKVGANQGNSPSANPAKWDNVAFNDRKFANDWVTKTIYFLGDVVFHPDNNKLFRNTVASFSLSTDLNAEIVAAKWVEVGVGKKVVITPFRQNVAIAVATLGDQMIIAGNYKDAIGADAKVYITGSSSNDGERDAPIVTYDGGGDQTRMIFDTNLADSTNDGTVLIGFNGTAISAADASTKKFTITGNHGANINVDNKIVITGSTANDGVYTVVTGTDTGGNTEVVVIEALGDDTGDGTLTYFNSAIAVVSADQLDGLIEVNGALATDYGLTVNDRVIVSGSTGNDGSKVVSEVIELATTTLIRCGITNATDDGSIDYPIKLNITHNLHSQYNTVSIYSPTDIIDENHIVDQKSTTVVDINITRADVVVDGNYKVIIIG